MSASPPAAALLLIDVQEGFDDPAWGPRDNPQADDNIARLVDLFIADGSPVVYVRHDSLDPDSPLRPDRPGNALKHYLPAEPTLLVTRHSGSAFAGTPDLDEWLMANGVTDVVIAGMPTNLGCETTARVAADLGYRVHFVIDATHSFDKVADDGRRWTARELSQVTAVNLSGEVAEVWLTRDLVGEERTAVEHSVAERDSSILSRFATLLP